MQHQTSDKTSLLIISISLIITCIISLQGLMHPSVEGLDASHNVMDGLFFYDLFGHDIWRMTSLQDLISYPVSYHEQYPALGFVYWPPFWPVIESVFFGIFGTTLLSAQLSVSIFTAIFCMAFLSISCRISNLWLGVGALLALLTTRELFFAANTIMRDLPAIAMMMTTFWATLKWIESGYANKWLSALVLSAAIALYTKQTSGLIVVTLFIALIFYNPKIFKTKSMLVGIACFVALALPLVIFTLTVASQNLGQSFGNATTSIMQDYKGLERWSAAGWLFYLKWFLWESPSLLVLSAIGSCNIILKQKQTGKNYIDMTLIIWVILFYLLFSFFDNKSARFTTLATPALALLSVEGLVFLVILLKQDVFSKKIIVCCLLLLTVMSAPHVTKTFKPKVPQMRNIDEVASLMLNITDASHQQKCISYNGEFKQVFVQAIRRLDRTRKIFIVDASSANHNKCAIIAYENNLLNVSLQNELAGKRKVTETYFYSPNKKRELSLFYRY